MLKWHPTPCRGYGEVKLGFVSIERLKFREENHPPTGLGVAERALKECKEHLANSLSVSVEYIREGRVYVAENLEFLL